MFKKYPYSDILGWSASRSELFHQCKRHYFYQYYPKYVQTYPVEKVIALRALTSVPLEIGRIVHEGIAQIISGPLKHSHIQDTNPNAIAGKNVDLMKEALKNKSFIEDYYPQYPRDKNTDIKDGLEKIKTSISQFFNNSRYEWLKNCSDELKKKWVIEPKDYGECRIEDLKAYCKVDFAFPDGKGGYYVLDWKTGRIDEEKHKAQMLGYIFYTTEHFSVSVEKVTPLIIYLGADYKELMITKEVDLEAFKDKVKSDTGDMYSYCADIDRNIPLDEDKFKRISNTGFCAYCNFQEICNKAR